MKTLICTVGLPRSGKAQPLYVRIKTPNGWKAMGDMKVGDVVCTPDGGTANVIGVFPQGPRPTYRLTFEDGRTTDCDENHLWKVYSHNWKYENCGSKKRYKIETPEQIVSLKKIAEQASSTFYVPLPQPLFGEPRALPLDPYVLGLLLGDGSYCNKTGGGVTFTTTDKENLQNLKERLLEGYYLNKVTGTKCCYTLTHGKNGVINHYAETLRNLKLWGKRAWEKSIPAIYKEASVEQRLELLRGLMDTDGEVNGEIKAAKNRAWGEIAYCTSSYQLALDVQYLVRSLGGLCRIKIKKSFYRTKEGIKKRCRTCFRCRIRHPNPELLIRLSRKRERALARSRCLELRCKLQDIKYLGIRQAQCIVVDHPDHLYVTDSFIVTHNSTWCASMIDEGWIVINPDSIRLALHGKAVNPQAEGLVWTITRTSIKALFLAGHDRVILDATNVSRRSRKDWEKLLPDVSVRFKMFNTDKEVCIQRARANNQPDLVEAIERMSQKLQPLLPGEIPFD